MINDHTTELNFPLPHQENDLMDDVLRIRATLTSIDQYLSEVIQHATSTGNAHGLKAKDIGLDKVDNTADVDKPVSKATQNEIDRSLFTQSARYFTLGTLIVSSIDYSKANGEPFLLEIDGNSYGATLPFLLRFQGYIYNNTIISAAGFSVGCQITGMVALNVGGKLCFWFPYQDYWQGFSVFVSTSLAGVKKNRLISIDNSAKPDGASKEFAVSDKITPVLHAENFHNYAPRLNGNGAYGTWPISVTGSAGTASYADVIDGSRDAAKITSDFRPRTVRYDFVRGDTAGNPGSFYSGVMTYVPYEGKTDGGGGNSYQLAFGSNINYGSTPDLKLRNGADGNWNAWSTVWHSGNINFNVQPYANTLVQRDGNGYINGNYLYMTDEGTFGNGAAGSVTGIICKRGDHYYRNTNATSVKAFLAITGADVQAQRGNMATDVGTSRELRWNKYGNGHTLVDLSSGVAPDGSAKNNSDPQNPWSETYPVLMGFNGNATYGVRVDSARVADRLAQSTNTSITYANGRITGISELLRGAVVSTTAITYNADGSVNTVATTTNGHTRTETYQYANGDFTGMTAVET